MPIFRYKGYKPDGAETSGAVDAEGYQDAVLKLKKLNIFPGEVREYRHRGERRFFRRNNIRLLPYITRQLSTLLAAGVPLKEALKSLSEEGDGFWRGLLVAARERIEGGASLSRAMEGFPEVFPEFYVNMVAAGEQSGTLDKALSRLADFLERQASINSKIKSSMIYPVFMVCVGFIVMSFLFVFVIPKIVRIFEDSKSALPFVTVVLIGVSNFFVNYWWLITALAASSVILIRKMSRERRDLMDRLKLRIPGGMLQSLYYARFTRTLGFLLDGGLPMLRSLELSAKSAGNIVLEKKIRDAGKRVAEGARLSSSLDGFPPVLLQLISTGEKGGRLPEVLNKAADSYEEEFGRRVQRALYLLEPSMILLMGIIIAFIVFAVLLPMFQLNQIVK